MTGGQFSLAKTEFGLVYPCKVGGFIFDFLSPTIFDFAIVHQQILLMDNGEIEYCQRSFAQKSPEIKN